jgi:hypothetical protein
MVQGLSRRLLIAEKHVRSHVSPCGSCGRRSSIDTDFSPNTSVFLSQKNSTSISYDIFFHLGGSQLCLKKRNSLSLSFSYTRTSCGVFSLEELTVGHQIKNLLQKLVVSYLELIICMLNTVHTFIIYLFDIHFNIITFGKIRKL